jgi:putative addiction module component (TIGR02574 family)
MAVTMKALGIDPLSAGERLALVQEIWDSLGAEAQRFPIIDAQRWELERRAAAHEAAPGDVIPWEEVKAQALRRAGQ